MMDWVALGVSLLFCIVCYNIGVCYMNLSQFEAAEEALLESLRIVSTIYPQGHDEITISETTFSYSSCEQTLILGISVAEQLLHEVWQLKSGQWQ